MHFIERLIKAVNGNDPENVPEKVCTKCSLLRNILYQEYLKKNDYSSAASIMIAGQFDVYEKDVLVVGCNVGYECEIFTKLGARSVHGVDVVDDVGNGFKHPVVEYFKMSAEDMHLPSNAYDLVFVFATMEHIKNIESAFKEIVRVAKPGGGIYCVASPLWNSRYGHHKANFFVDAPWIHLLMSRDEIIAYCETKNIKDVTGNLDMDVHVDYMLNREYFNKTNSCDYIETCERLTDIKIIRNGIDYDDESVLSEELSLALAAKGYDKRELLAVTHTFIAQKLG